jgi:hypothetical protein
MIIVISSVLFSCSSHSLYDSAAIAEQASRGSGCIATCTNSDKCLVSLTWRQRTPKAYLSKQNHTRWDFNQKTLKWCKLWHKTTIYNMSPKSNHNSLTNIKLVNLHMDALHWNAHRGKEGLMCTKKNLREHDCYQPGFLRCTVMTIGGRKRESLHGDHHIKNSRPC